MNQGHLQILAEIKELVKTGVELNDILVSEDENGQHVWGEPTALQTDDMVEAMSDIDWTTNGMRTGIDFCYAHGVNADTLEIE
jgi:hypothetical protein